MISRRRLLKGMVSAGAMCTMAPIRRAWGLAGELYLDEASGLGEFSRVDPSRVKEIYGGLDLYYGDIHGHTGFSDGYGTPTEYFDRAKYDQHLDFTAMSDHAEWVNEFQGCMLMEDGSPIPLWEKTVKAADEVNVNGEFVTLPGFEWSSKTYGHRNVYFRDTRNIVEAPFGCDSELYRNPDLLWGALEPYQALTIAHHPMRPGYETDWSYTNPMERLVEIYSKWGASESIQSKYERCVDFRKSPDLQAEAAGHSVMDMLRDRRYRIGIIAGSDSHQGLAGSTAHDDFRGISLQGYPGFNDTFCGMAGEQYLQLLRQGFTFDYREPWGGAGGLAAVWSPELSREAIWDGLYDRHTFGTTGVRPEFYFAVLDSDDKTNTAIMGEEIEITGVPIILVTIKAVMNTNIKKMTLLKNGGPIAVYSSETENAASLAFRDDEYQPGDSAFYMIKVILNQVEFSNSDHDRVLFYDEDKEKFYFTRQPQLTEQVWSSPIWVG